MSLRGAQRRGNLPFSSLRGAQRRGNPPFPVFARSEAIKQSLFFRLCEEHSDEAISSITKKPKSTLNKKPGQKAKSGIQFFCHPERSEGSYSWNNKRKVPSHMKRTIEKGLNDYSKDVGLWSFFSIRFPSINRNSS